MSWSSCGGSSKKIAGRLTHVCSIHLFLKKKFSKGLSDVVRDVLVEASRQRSLIESDLMNELNKLKLQFYDFVGARRRVE